MKFTTKISIITIIIPNRKDWQKMNEFINEIKSTLKDCNNSIKDYELSNEGGDHINQGWIEALEYVINTYNNYNNN